MTRIWLAGLALTLTCCAARAEPLEAEGVVVAAGPAAPVTRGSRCSLGLWPAWRQGVNCQLLLRCGGTDLFGGKRVGGYAVCETRDRHFERAVDDKPFDGDPALDLDLRARRIRWQDALPAATLEIALLEVHEYSLTEVSSEPGKHNKDAWKTEAWYGNPVAGFPPK